MRRSAIARLSGITRDRRGTSTILLAGSLVASLGCAAFAVDSASLYLASRRLQGAADAAALAAAGDLSNAQARATQAIGDSAIREPVGLLLTTGMYRPDPAIAPRERYAAGGANPNAARVVLSERAPLFFGVLTLGRRDAPISRTATATRTNLAAFSIGSRLAAVDGGVANALAGALTGSQASLNAMDYRALLDADVDLFDFVQALRTEAHLRAGSFDDALDATVAPSAALRALADALSSGGSSTAAAAAAKLADAAGGAAPLPLDRLLDLGPYGAQDHVSGTRISAQAWDLARAVLEAASAGRQLKLDLTSTTGLSQLTIYLSVGDREADSPWLAVTDSGTPIVRTAQTRLFIDAVVGTAALGLPGTASVRMPVYIELAAAQARLNALTCSPRSGTEQVTLDVQPSVGHASLAQVDPAALADQRTPVAETPARLVALPLITADGSARIDLSADSWASVGFDQSEIAAHVVKTVSSANFVSAIAGSLAQRATLTARVLGVGVSTQAVTTATSATLTAGAPTLDGLVGALLGLLGIHLGQADVRIAGVRCGQAVLVG